MAPPLLTLDCYTRHQTTLFMSSQFKLFSCQCKVTYLNEKHFKEECLSFVVLSRQTFDHGSVGEALDERDGYRGWKDHTMGSTMYKTNARRQILQA